MPAGLVLDQLLLPLASGCINTSASTNGPTVTLVIGGGGGTAAAAAAEAAFAVVPTPWQQGIGLFDTYLQLDLEAVGTFADATHARVMQIQVHCGTRNDNKVVVNKPAFPEPAVYGPPLWDVPLVGYDDTTQGGWVGRYGARGHLLFGLEGTCPLPRNSSDLSTTVPLNEVVSVLTCSSIQMS